MAALRLLRRDRLRPDWIFTSSPRSVDVSSRCQSLGSINDAVATEDRCRTGSSGPSPAATVTGKVPACFVSEPERGLGKSQPRGHGSPAHILVADARFEWTARDNLIYLKWLATDET
jgi:hypothetical protein